MNFENELICTDSEGNENQFLYSIEELEEDGHVKWIFKVMPADLQATDWYEFAVTKIDDSTGKVTLMNNRNMIQYKGKGITEKLIDEASKLLNMTIISSTSVSGAKSLATEWRTEAATKIWERLKAKGAASHDKQSDIYTYLKE
jgi:hypothetical protein